MKAIDRGRLTKKLQENLESEIAIMRDFSHPNLVGFVELRKKPEKIYLVLERVRPRSVGRSVGRSFAEAEEESRVAGSVGEGPRCVLRRYLDGGDLQKFIRTHKKLKETTCLLYTSPSPRDQRGSRMPSSA